MDKIAANNLFVVLRKEIKKAKAMVCGNLIRKINKFKEEKEKTSDEKLRNKLESKIAALLDEIKLTKTLDPYDIAKQATLRPDVKSWEKIIGDSKATAEQRSIARVICKNNIQKQVTKFRTDYKDCDEWINEYIEYREKKKDLIEAEKPSKRKPKPQKVTNKQAPGDSSAKRDSRERRPRKERVDEVEPKKEDKDAESLHPSWESKRKQKELLKAALSGEIKQPKRIKFAE